LFILLDAALAIGAVGTLGYAGYRAFDAPLEPQADAALEEATGDEAAFRLPEARPRGEYDFIAATGIFGDAGRWDRSAAPPPPPPPPPVDETPEDTQLNLRLVGTSALSQNDPLASAIIEDSDQRTILAYGVGDPIKEKVTLRAVRQREVILWNEMKSPPGEERLAMGEGDPMVMAQRPAAAAPVVNDSRTERITLNRDEMIQDIYASYTDLITKVRPEMYRDANGNVIGVTADNISQVPIAAKLGIADGDVLQTVNNEQIDSEQKIMEMVQKYRNAGSFRIGILRNGKPKVITYRLE
jgi:type II secretory pathway component PulC